MRAVKGSLGLSPVERKKRKAFVGRAQGMYSARIIHEVLSRNGGVRATSARRDSRDVSALSLPVLLSPPVSFESGIGACSRRFMNDAGEATSPDLRVKKPRGIVAGKFSSESLTNTFHVSRFTRS